MDPLVVSLPKMLRFPLVKLIAGRRCHSSAEAYAKIWDEAGSPLVVHAELLAARIRANTQLPVAVGMRYGEPSFETAQKQLIDCDEIVAISPYPQYAASTYQSTVNHLQTVFTNQAVYINRPYFDDADFVSALKDVILRHLTPEVEHVLFSFHSLPEQHVRNGDPTGSHCLKHASCCETSHVSHETCYRHQCRYLAAELSTALKVPSSISFQSRLGPTKWLKPYTLHEVRRLAEEGIRTLAVACPSFISDNIETLHEIAIEVRDAFVEAGGMQLKLLPCLNESEAWVELVSRWCESDIAHFQKLDAEN